MRSYVTFAITSFMTVALLFLLLSRDKVKHDAPDADPEPVEISDAGDGGADASFDAEAGAREAGLPDAGPAPVPVEKPLRVVTLGWELALPGAALASADGGTTPALELAPETTLEAVETRLARGGGDVVGADVAVLPLPAFVAGYDRLRALDPRAFLVVGFSHAREEVRAAPGSLLKAPPGGDEVKVVGLSPATASEAGARASGSESATVLGLFALDLLGVPASRVRFVAPGSADAKAAPFAALVRGAADERKLAFSTADASRFVPIVAVAPKGILERNEATIRAFSLAWLDGLAKAGKDAPNVARRLAAKEALPLAGGIGGAPEAIHLIERLGQIEAVGLADQRRWLGPDAKGTVTIDTLLTRTWQLARAGGLTTNGAPETLPTDAKIVTSIAPASAPEVPKAEGIDAGAPLPTAPAGATPLVAYRVAEGDAEKVAAQIGFLSGVFERGIFRISAKGGDKAARAIATAAREKFALPAARFATVNAEPQGAFAVVEILSPP